MRGSHFQPESNPDGPIVSFTVTAGILKPKLLGKWDMQISRAAEVR